MVRGFGTQAFAWVFAGALSGCSASPPPEPRATVAEAPPAAAAPGPRARASAQAATSGAPASAAAPPAASAARDRDALRGGSFPPACHVAEELARAFDAMNPGGDSHNWIVEAGARHLQPDPAGRGPSGI